MPLKSPGVLPYRSEGQQLTYYEFSTWPLGLSHPVGAGHWANADLFPPFLPEELSDQELSTVAEQLYELLKRLRGYEVAMVGWDPESWVDIEFWSLSTRRTAPSPRSRAWSYQML